MPRITIRERKALIEGVAQHKISQRNELQNAKNWGQLYRYTGLIGLMGVLSSPDIKPNQSEHLKKMVAFEAGSISERKRRPKTASQFWEAVSAEAGPQISQLEAISAEEAMPREYQLALADLLEVRELVADPLIMALRQSVRAAQRNK